MSGEAYTVPFMEGFKEGNLQSIWRPETYEADWVLYPGLSTDEDGFLMGLRIKDYDAIGRLSSGKIDISGVKNPMLAFTFYAYPGEDATFTVEIGSNGGVATKALSVDFKDLDGEEGFRTLLADLKPYRDSKYINLIFTAEVADCEECPVILLDDVNVRDVADANLELSLGTPFKASVGDPCDIDVKVFNVGLTEASEAKVNLFVEGKLVGTLGMPAVAPFCRGKVSCPFTPDALHTGNLEVRAELDWRKDMVSSDNVAQTTLSVNERLLNRVESLVVEESEGMDILKWTAPDLSSEITESFEGYNPFVYDGFGDWQVYDGDGMTPMAVVNVQYPGKNQAAAFFPADFEALGFESSVLGEVVGHSGPSFVACVRPSTLTNDDWLLSPELSGNEQTVSFWAKTIGAMFSEEVTLLYSAGGTDISDFTPLESFEITESYEEYEVRIPAGAKYFAFHCDSFYGGMLMIDDVTFEAKRTLLGYNVYCNGELLKYVDAAETEHTCKPMEGTRAYVVTAVYAEGESASSNEASLSGVLSVIDGVTVTTESGELIIKGASNRKVSIDSIEGINYFYGNGDEIMQLTLNHGMYVITVDGKVLKVII